MNTNDNISLLVDLYSEREMKKQAISFFIKKHHPNLYSEIMGIINDGTFLVNAYCYINHLVEKPKCHCGKNTTFVSMVKGFSKTCSYKCMGAVENTKQKRKETTISKYGVENISSITRDRAVKKRENRSTEEKASSLQKYKETCLKNNGVTNPNKSKLFSIHLRKKLKDIFQIYLYHQKI